jgi:hypothetical protein
MPGRIRAGKVVLRRQVARNRGGAGPAGGYGMELWVAVKCRASLVVPRRKEAHLGRRQEHRDMSIFIAHLARAKSTQRSQSNRLGGQPSRSRAIGRIFSWSLAARWCEGFMVLDSKPQASRLCKQGVQGVVSFGEVPVAATYGNGARANSSC